MKALSDDFMKMVSGGTLPDDWEEDVDDLIKRFKNYSGDGFEFGSIPGVTKDAEGMIKLLKTSWEGEIDLSKEELETVFNYIRNNYR